MLTVAFYVKVTDLFDHSIHQGMLKECNFVGKNEIKQETATDL